MALPYPESASTDALWRSPAGRLLLGHCRACDGVHHYPRPVCPLCGSMATDLVESTGGGTVVSYTVTRNSDEAAPPVLAFVEVDEGVALLTRIAAEDPDAVRIGARVSVVFREDELGGAPQFVLDLAGAAG
ncbi:Zn-ribbon domain-containing OB-fold protein [Pseudonocardia halophobica]|uniref:DNA-binding protein n=1 Tax=Pseudonocardia halophobica TaxID=29401 RepID=A0A9W6NUN4_9PSEU|nr:OB-fold domain-containing protein [Pseudonocardia halophobica]GLL09778.1 hypothetical protein GCM10017577_09180 [Pseudonocardia halophobica]